MKDNDILQRFIFEDIPVRGELVHLNESYQTILQQHSYTPLIRQLLGEALAVACLLIAVTKLKGRLTVQFKGKGKLKLLLVQCDHHFNLRGLIQSEGDLTQAELLEAQSRGVLAIMMDPEMTNAKRYQGIVEWEGQTLTQAIEGYFRQSEQLPTRLWLAVNENSAAGLLLQVLPKEKPELYDNEWEHLIHLTETITADELLQLDNDMLLHRLYSEENVRLFSQTPVAFRCTCSVQRSENAILLLGQEEAEQELKEKQKLVVTCEFCNKGYIFDRVDVASLFKKRGQPPASTQMH